MLRRVIHWFSILSFLSFLVLVGGISWSIWRAGRIPQENILRIEFDGPIYESPRPHMGLLMGQPAEPTLHQMLQGIRDAAQDPRIKGLLLDVRTPQLGIAQLEEIAEAIRTFRESGKRIISYFETAGEMGHGDGAFALATLADHVIINPAGDVNLSGLQADVGFYKGALERAHVGVYTEQRYEFKNYANSFHETGFTPAHKESLKFVLDDLQQTLLKMIADNRRVSVPHVRDWVLNAPFSAQAARAVNMVDEVAYWDVVDAQAKHLVDKDDPYLDLGRYCARRQKKPQGATVALIVASGEIHRGDGRANLPIAQTASIGSETFAQALRDAREDEVDAVLLRIDSPGGSYIASDVLRHEVALTRDANIPVVVSMGNTAASGGYMLATDADHIIAQAGTITGSIGVLAASFSVREALLHWLGITYDSYATLPHPGTLSFLDPPSVEDKKRLSTSIDRIYHDFVDKVARGRHQQYAAIDQVAKGRIWTGRQALERGLVDELGGYTEATQYLRQRLKLAPGEQIEFVAYPDVPHGFDALRDLAGAFAVLEKFAASLQNALHAFGISNPVQTRTPYATPEL